MTVIDLLSEEFKQQMYALASQACWSVAAGEGTGSVIGLDFGKKIPRVVPLTNLHLTEDQRYYKAEMSLFIECAWRLDSRNEVICGSSDSDANDGPMVRGLALVVDQKVVSIELSELSWDVTIKFTGDLFLKVFCDQTNVEEEVSNYSLHLEDRIYTVGPRGKLNCGPRRWKHLR